MSKSEKIAISIIFVVIKTKKTSDEVPAILSRFWQRNGETVQFSAFSQKTEHFTLNPSKKNRNMRKRAEKSRKSRIFQPTAEEMCTELISSLSPLKKSQFPVMLYQIGDKFRDEMNPRFGLLRSRQFLMKDMYTFSTDTASALATYRSVCHVYDRIFNEILKFTDEDVIKVEADSGVHGGSMSHEYHLRSQLDEDYVNHCQKCENFNKNEAPECPKCSESTERLSSVEVGHTFHLGTRYSAALGAKFAGKPLEMCCFGIGVSRILPAAVDVMSVSSKALRLPRAISPFDAVIIVKKVSSFSPKMPSKIDKFRFPEPNVKCDRGDDKFFGFSIPERRHSTGRSSRNVSRKTDSWSESTRSSVHCGAGEWDRKESSDNGENGNLLEITGFSMKNCKVSTKCCL